MKRIIAASIDFFICYIIACTARLIINLMLLFCVIKFDWWHYIFNFFLEPFISLYESYDFKISTYLFNYGLLSTGGILIFLYVSVIIYVMVSELRKDGRTFGKRIMKLEVCLDDKKELIFRKLQRAVLKLVSMFFWYFILFYYMQYNKMPYDKRLGITIQEKNSEKI